MLEYHVQIVHERNCSEVSPLLSKDEFGNLVYKCHSCNYFSSKPTHVTEHIQVEHFGVKTERLVRRQLNTAKSNQMESKCDYCDYVGKKRNVTKHMQGKHLGVKYTCDKCGWQCSDPSNLKKHIRSKHTELSKCVLEKSQPLVKPYSIVANIGERSTASEDVKTGYKIVE